MWIEWDHDDQPFSRIHPPLHERVSRVKKEFGRSSPKVAAPPARSTHRPARSPTIGCVLVREQNCAVTTVGRDRSVRAWNEEGVTTLPRTVLAPDGPHASMLIFLFINHQSINPSTFFV
jgi:hypothetical protein